MKPTTRIRDAGPKRCLNGIFEIPESFSTVEASVAPCLLVLWTHIMHRRVTQPANETGRGQRIERVPEEETNWLPTPESGPFSMKLRQFWLTSKVLDGTCTPKAPRYALRSVTL
jgi:hypothetical protein